MHYTWENFRKFVRAQQENSGDTDLLHELNVERRYQEKVRGRWIFSETSKFSDNEPLN
jgi:hypothetical protein